MSIQVVKTEGLQCPFCKNKIDSSTIIPEFFDGKISVDISCPLCGEEFTDWYNYENTTYTDITLSDD